MNNIILIPTFPPYISENKGADQLRGYREADLRLCFRICKKSGFLTSRLIIGFSGDIMNNIILIPTFPPYVRRKAWCNVFAEFFPCVRCMRAYV